jgi:hypothetical protein
MPPSAIFALRGQPVCRGIAEGEAGPALSEVEGSNHSLCNTNCI